MLGVAWLPARLGVAVGEDRRQALRVVLVAGAQGVEQLVGDHHRIARAIVAACKSLHDADLPLPEAHRMVELRRACRVVVEHEQAHVRPWPRRGVVAPGPEAQLQAP